MRVLSDDMFMMLKMENSDYVARLEKTDLCEFLRQLCAEYYDEMTAEGYEFVIDIPEEKMIVDMDKSLFARVITNLFTNARKYNQTGNKIAISCRREKEKIQVMVCDNGSAIPLELAEQIFLPFVRGDKTRKSDGGTGLGLAISKIIVEKHGGTIFYKRVKEWNVFEINLKENR